MPNENQAVEVEPVASTELSRIIFIPERPPIDCTRYFDPTLKKLVYPVQTQALVEVMTARFSINRNCSCKEKGYSCITELNAEQAWTLREFGKYHGILGFLPIGSGKTLISILAPLAVPGVKRAVLLAKADQRLHYRRMWERLSQHFRVPSFVMDDDGEPMIRENMPVLHFVPYSKLSRPESTRLLNDLNPDLVVGDELHCLSDRFTSRSIRAFRFLASRQGLHFAGWSGSLLDKSLRSVAHLSAYALGDQSPMPINPSDVEAWASVLDPSPKPDRYSSIARGIFRAFIGETASTDSILGLGINLRRAREGFQKRLSNTPGVITSKATSSMASITIHERPIKMPESVREAVTSVRGWVRPDGEELVEAIEQIRCLLHVTSGHYYFWRFGKEPVELIEDWFMKRKNFARELRAQILKGQEYLDSRFLCECAAARAWMGGKSCEHCQGTGLCDGRQDDKREAFELSQTTDDERAAIQTVLKYDDERDDAGDEIVDAICNGICSICGGAGDGRYRGKLPIWKAATWPAWCEIRDKVKHDQQVKWIDDFLAKDAAKWALENKGLVWCISKAFGQRVAELSGLEYHDGGVGAEEKLFAEKGDRSIILSVKANSEGRDGLQHLFNTQLVAQMPSSGRGWGQLLGRLCRPGQAAEEIITYVYLHFNEAKEQLRKSLRDAEFNQDMTAGTHLLAAADFTFDL